MNFTNRYTAAPLFGTFDRLFTQALNGPFRSILDAFEPNSRFRVYKKDQGFDLETDLPGFDKSDLKLTTEDGHLKLESKESAVRTFGYELKLPDAVDASKIRATLEDGVLKLHLPLREELQQGPKNIEIA